MLFSRFTLYFDEIARSGSIRAASDRLRIAPSAIDRQILKIEESLGVPLFERRPQGLRLTAAGEVLIDAVRRWRRDYVRTKAQIDELRGLKRGEVSIALVEGSMDFAARCVKTFQAAYPGITYRIRVHGSNTIVDLVKSGEVDIGLTFNPPDNHTLRVENTLIHQIGVVAPAGHPLADLAEVELADCVAYPLIVPDESISLRAIFNQTWATTVGGMEQFAVSVNSVACMKRLVIEGSGIAVLTRMDVTSEVRAGLLKYVPLKSDGISLSVLSLVVASGRTLPVPALMLLQHLSRAMGEEKETPAAE